MIETGKTYRISYGNGSQLFHVTRISSKGQPFGYRLFGTGGTWTISSLKVNDPRIEVEWPASYRLTGTPLPPLPTPLATKIDLKPLKGAITGPLADYEAYDAKEEAEWSGDDWFEKRDADREGWSASIDEGNRLRRILWPLRDALREAKTLNTLAPAKGDLESFGEETSEISKVFL